MKTWYIRILPRPEVLDVQGRTVLQMLKNQGLPFSGARVGKIIELQAEQDIPDAPAALKKAMQMGLYNPLIEVAAVE